MKFLRLKYFEHINHQVIKRERIINIKKIKQIRKFYPDKLNPDSPHEIWINFDSRSVSTCQIRLKNKSEADFYFNYIMEKLRVIELKTTPW